MAPRELILSAPEIALYLAEVFPQTEGRFEIEDLCPLAARVRVKVGEEDLRPGGTVSGPTMFLAADVAFYIVTLGMVGRKALTVTTSATINFMRKPDPVDLIAEARILKLWADACGRRCADPFGREGRPA